VTDGEPRRYLFARIRNYRHRYPRTCIASVRCEWKEFNRREIGRTREENGEEKRHGTRRTRTIPRITIYLALSLDKWDSILK